MKKLFKAVLSLVIVSILSPLLVSCMDSEKTTWDTYREWREFNENWLIEQTTRTNPDGTPFYTRRTMPTDPQAYILMHTIGETHDGLTPMFTSTAKVNYTLSLANDSVVDSGTDFVTQLNTTTLITGWSLAIMQMHVGDTAQFIIPYNIGYGSTETSMLKPYSNLRFNIRLVDIPTYEVRP